MAVFMKYQESEQLTHAFFRNQFAESAFLTRPRPREGGDAVRTRDREGIRMSGFIHWLEGAVTYIAAVTGLSVLCFVAMRLLA
jgi:hypothetical protein